MKNQPNFYWSTWIDSLFASPGVSQVILSDKFLRNIMLVMPWRFTFLSAHSLKKLLPVYNSSLFQNFDSTVPITFVMGIVCPCGHGCVPVCICLCAGWLRGLGILGTARSLIMLENDCHFSNLVQYLGCPSVLPMTRSTSSLSCIW